MQQKRSRPQNALNRDNSEAIPLRNLRLHAEQLATHLSALGNDLDRREAELTAEQARRDCEFRAARLWVAMRVTNLEDLVEQVREQVYHMRSIHRTLHAESGKHSAATPRDFDLVSIEQQLKTLELHLASCSRPMTETVDSTDTVEAPCTPSAANDLAAQTARLDFRERTLESARRELAIAHRETVEIRDSAEILLQHLSECQKPAHATTFTDSSAQQHPLARHTQALEEAEGRLQSVYAQVLDERKKMAELKQRETPPGWEQERFDLLQQIKLLQSTLRGVGREPPPRKAA